MGRRLRWTTPSDLAEYAYCPRAHAYRQQHGPPPASAGSVAGTDYHERSLVAERRRADHPVALWLVALTGAALLLAALLFAAGVGP